MPFRFDGGLHLPGPDLWLDPHRRQRFAYVSHGHSDHCVPHAQALATPATAAFYRRRTGRDGVRVLPFGHPLELRGHTLELFPAGHVLGASQAQITTPDGLRLVYTGDFKLRSGPAAEPAEVRRCDVLVMECTFGHPRYQFPALEEIGQRLRDFVDRCLAEEVAPVVCAYALGKGQEALALLTSLGYRVLAHELIYGNAQVYESLGVDLGRYERLTPELVDSGDARGSVLLVPPHVRDRPPLSLVWPRRTVYLSGWAIDQSSRIRFGVDEMIPLSDHADFAELLEYVERAQPRMVFTLHGEAGFAAQLRRRGVQAYHLPDQGQLVVS